MLKFEEYIIPSATLGKLNPMPDIHNVKSYLHSAFETTPEVSEEEARYLGKGAITTTIPYMQQDDYTREKKPHAFKAAILENDYIRAVFLPEVGGRLWSLFDKEKNRELLYKNPVFQPANLALRNAWFSGGVEFNVGVKGHNPLTCSPMWCAADTTTKGDVLRLYEYERSRGVAYCGSAYLPENSKTLYLNVRIENTSDEEKYMYWWTNIAVPESKETRIIVPAEKAFVCSYNETNYIIGKTKILDFDGVDTTYPYNTKRARDFFYDIPKENHKWIVSVDKDGKGLLHTSTKELISRKLFLWGQSRGGKRWNEWLSEEGSRYIEIQAGLAHTQLEHIPMPAKTAWEWTEAYTAFDCEPENVHGEYDSAVNTVENYISERIGDPDNLSFPTIDDVQSRKIIYKASGWGNLAEKISGVKLSDNLEFEKVNDYETSQWHQLVNEGTFPNPSVDTEPISYMSDAQTLKKLENLPKQSWYSLLNIGIIRFALGDADGAKKAWEESLSMKENAWAYRNLAMLYKGEYNDIKTAIEYIIKAFDIKKDCRPLAIELASILTLNGDDGRWLELHKKLPDEIKENERIKFLTAIAYMHLEMFDEATKIVNKDFCIPDVREGEVSLSKIWFELYRRIYAKETGVEYDENDVKLAQAADEKYPLPFELDFRQK